MVHPRNLWKGRAPSIESLLLAIGTPRLRCLGFTLHFPNTFPTRPEIALYDLLGETHGNEALARYNALVRRLVSFERAYEQRTWK